MVATSTTIDRLRRGDAALGSAISNLLEALDAYRGAGRPDLAAPLRSAVAAVRQAEVLRQTETGRARARDPLDWFLD